MAESKPLEEATVEELVEALGPIVNVRDVGHHGENVGEVLGNVAIVQELHDRGAMREAAKLALEKWPEQKEHLDQPVEEWLAGFEEADDGGR